MVKLEQHVASSDHVQVSINSDGVEHASREFLAYSIVFEEEKNTLWGVAHEQPSAKACADKDNPYQLKDIERALTHVTLANLQRHLKKLGYHEFCFQRNSLEGFVRKIKQNAPGRYRLAERRHAEIKLTVSRDRLSARALTSEAFGGSPLTKERVADAIKKAKLDARCVIDSAVDKLLNSRAPRDILIAKAHAPIHGKDGALVLSVVSKKDVARDVESIKAIDLHDIYEYTVVEKGEILARKTPPTEGKPGLNVLGKTIKPKPGRTVNLPKKAAGVAHHPEDKNILIAAIKGHPVVSAGQIKVDPVFCVKDVDYKTGNIDYDGTVVINGRVRVGFEVCATGDIFVKGFVNKCRLSSGGSVFLSGGVQGDHLDEGHTTVISAKHNIEAKFINQSKVHCLGELIVQEYVLNCDTVALKGVSVGLKSGKGALIGGNTKTNGRVQAKTLGSDAYVTTNVELGTISAAQTELEKWRLKKARRAKEAKQLEHILEKLNRSGEATELGQLTLDKARKVEETLISLRHILDEYEGQIAALQAVVPDAEQLSIHIRNVIYPNVEIAINDACYTTQSAHKKVVIEKIEGEIVFNRLQNQL